MIKSYSCPNPTKRGGCGCPQSSARCYADIRAVREVFNRHFDEGGLMAAIHETLAEVPGKGWTETELMRRFLTVTRVQ